MLKRCLNQNNFDTFISGSCYQSVLISARDPVKTKQSTKMGQFYFYKMGSNGRPIYKNQRKQFLYSNSDSLWSVSQNYFNEIDNLIFLALQFTRYVTFCT